MNPSHNIVMTAKYFFREESHVLCILHRGNKACKPNTIPSERGLVKSQDWPSSSRCQRRLNAISVPVTFSFGIEMSNLRGDIARNGKSLRPVRKELRNAR